MNKSKWAPVMGKSDRQNGWRFCACCGWRRTKATFCDTCTQAACEAPPQSPRPTPIRISASSKRPMTAKQQAYFESILPVTCKVCGAGDHTSATCTTQGLTRE